MTDHGLQLGKSSTLDELCNSISEILRVPITIEDRNHHVLAYSIHDSATSDPARIATIMSHQVPQDVIDALWKQGSMALLSEESDPVMIPSIDNVGLHQRVAISVRRGTEVIGYIWALEKHPFSQEDLAFLKEAARSVSVKLIQWNDRRVAREEKHNEFFLGLLMGQFRDARTIQNQAQSLGVKLPTYLSVGVFGNDPTEPELFNKIRYITSTRQGLQVVFSLIYKDQLILLLGRDHVGGVTDMEFRLHLESMVGTLHKHLPSCQWNVGFGNVSSDYKKVKDSYQEALAVVKLRQTYDSELEQIYTYDKLGVFRYIYQLAEAYPAELLGTNCLKPIEDYDERHRTDLLQTLEAYLDSDGNMQEVAQNLHIHINTLTYRLGRISQVLDVNLRNPGERMDLYFELKLQKMLLTPRTHRK